MDIHPPPALSDEVWPRDENPPALFAPLSQPYPHTKSNLPTQLHMQSHIRPALRLPQEQHQQHHKIQSYPLNNNDSHHFLPPQQPFTKYPPTSHNNNTCTNNFSTSSPPSSSRASLPVAPVCYVPTPRRPSYPADSVTSTVTSSATTSSPQPPPPLPQKSSQDTHHHPSQQYYHHHHQFMNPSQAMPPQPYLPPSPPVSSSSPNSQPPSAHYHHHHYHHRKAPSMSAGSAYSIPSTTDPAASRSPSCYTDPPKVSAFSSFLPLRRLRSASRSRRRDRVYGRRRSRPPIIDPQPIPLSPPHPPPQSQPPPPYPTPTPGQPPSVPGSYQRGPHSNIPLHDDVTMNEISNRRGKHAKPRSSTSSWNYANSSQGSTANSSTPVSPTHRMTKHGDAQNAHSRGNHRNIGTPSSSSSQPYSVASYSSGNKHGTPSRDSSKSRHVKSSLSSKLKSRSRYSTSSPMSMSMSMAMPAPMAKSFGDPQTTPHVTLEGFCRIPTWWFARASRFLRLIQGSLYCYDQSKRNQLWVVNLKGARVRPDPPHKINLSKLQSSAPIEFYVYDEKSFKHWGTALMNASMPSTNEPFENAAPPLHSPAPSSNTSPSGSKHYRGNSVGGASSKDMNHLQMRRNHMDSSSMK